MSKSSFPSKFWSVFSTIGTIIAAVSAFNILRITLNISLSESIKALIDTYKLYAHKYLFDSIFFWIDYPVPTYIKDTAIIWMIMTGIVFRSVISIQNTVVSYQVEGKKISQYRGGSNWILSFTTYMMNRIWPFRNYKYRSYLVYKLYMFVVLLLLWPVYLFTFIFYKMEIRLIDEDLQPIESIAFYRTIVLWETGAILIGTLMIAIANAGYIHIS